MNPCAPRCPNARLHRPQHPRQPVRPHRPRHPRGNARAPWRLAAIPPGTLADLHIAPPLDFMAATPEWAELTTPYPNLVAWIARMTARPSLAATTWDRLDDIA
ncbi:MAG TPA: glutathione binding-like protein [Acetobacteraceae bacterium]|nr:glutathione binding-like protein [Acetobacteraceae bacterium]